MEKTVEEYISFLESKGFSFGEDAVGFIFFGKHYTNASDFLVNLAIEMTLKAQKDFDGSFYISLLEALKQSQVHTRSEAESFARDRGLLV
ncbi:hypothetical protein ELQ35_10835 [Peribacillus cavernae]|uniref:Uncharacterized protein n=1 Tax=Peribacillus cavernae TaxID=1674310 RepID=A0A433HLG9_9BACI|nr:DUF6123 family protein [Peribacillus cavernae]MDQ0218013.1 hypothetical protein [Peribacillus cavernae]RUQ28942.1 hypothetical protein ELQ35_10835 [Peribacillus cavernae]